MNISKTWEGKTLTVALEGRLDTMTSPELSAEFDQSLNDADQLIVDCSKLEYISSAGLRVLMIMRKALSDGKDFSLINMKDSVREIIETTGFDTIFC